MINRDWQEATVTTLSGALANIDEYGQPTVINSESARTIQVYKKIYAQTNVADPRYVDCEEIALTKDKEVTTSDILTVDGTSYAVKYIIPSPKYSTLLLQRKT